MINNKSERFSGLELLRVISMMMIIAIHIIGKGGLLEATRFGSLTNIIVIIIRSFAVSSVNCYVLISGYFMVDKPFKSDRITRTMIVVFEYSVILSMICFCTKQSEPSVGNIINTIFPVPMQDTYWFVTQYILLLLLSPILNRFIRSISQRQHKMIVVFCLILFSVIPAITVIKKSFFSTGTDIVWFCTLYFLAAYIRKYPVNYSPTRTFILFSGGGNNLLKLLCDWYSNKVVFGQSE